MTAKSNLGVSNFLLERKNDVSYAQKLNKVLRQDIPSGDVLISKKRSFPIVVRARYRTRSYKRFKINSNFVQRRKSHGSDKHRTVGCIKIVNKQKLTTHCWHSKRMVVRKQYGCSIPVHSNSFGYKKVENFVDNHCICHDMSYHRVLSLCGGTSDIFEHIKVHLVR